MQKNTILLLILSLSLFLIIQTNTVLAQPCQLGSTPSGCAGEPINVGYGAVELCNDCFVCGDHTDGVCPAWYSTGVTTNNVPVLLRKGTADRPTAATHSDYSISYMTGNQACQRFGGTFLKAQTKNTRTAAWADDNSITGSTNMNSRTRYVQAICNNVPKTPSCDTCIDFDCVTEVRGIAYSGVNNILHGANITILPNNAAQRTELYSRTNKSNEDGEYSIQAYSGDVIVLCAAEGYEATRRVIRLKPGMNIIDCHLSYAPCASDCTIPSSIYGQRICAKECQGENGCDFGASADEKMNACDRRPLGFFYELTTTRTVSSIIVDGINCCNTMQQKTYTLFNIGAENEISNLITRKYRKVLTDGTPVDLNIIVYNK